MRRLVVLCSVVSLALLGSCGSGGGGVPVLLGPYLVDFETRPDDGFVAVVPPVALGNGVTITSVTSGTLYDFTTADGWGFAACDAVATSGMFMMGADAVGPTTTVRITFDTPVARVELNLGDTENELVSLEALDAGLILFDGDDRFTGTCPILLTTHSVSSGDQNLIAAIQILGTVPAWDDLRFWRWTP